MTRHYRRPRPLLLLLLCLVVLCFTVSTVGKSSSTATSILFEDVAAPKLGGNEQIPLRDADEPEQEERPGDGEVREALVILNKLKPPTRKTQRFSKPSGALATTMYYAREAFTLLFMNGPQLSGSDSSGAPRKHSAQLSRAVLLLEQAAEQDNQDAIYILADMRFYGKYSHTNNFAQAFEGYQRLAALSGNSTAQHMIGFMYATGIGNVVEKDQAKALLYHTFAADAGDIRSQMTVAYRHDTGIATVRSCENAVYYYKKVADRAMRYIKSGPPGGRYPAKDAYNLADDEGGVYGEGASVGSKARQAGAYTDGNILEYLDLMSRKGELKATFGLGKVYYEGSRALKQDFAIARDYFLDVARRYWTRDGKIRPNTEAGVDTLASMAAGYLGRMFLRGEGMAQNYEKARKWFTRGVANGDSLCQYQLGLMHLHGYGVVQNPVKAAEFFGAAADQDFPAAQVRLGALLLDQGDIATATKYFELAARNGHMEAFYLLAELHNSEPERDCNIATSFYKIVAEKAEAVHSSFQEANEAYDDGDRQKAILLYMMAAEQGYEVGQANVAYLIDKPKRRSLLSRILPAMKQRASALLDDVSLALIYWTRSAKQTNIDSLVKMGDYYLFGLGTTDSLPDAEKAASCYQAAAETMQSAQAMWNLGWMHENGIGIEQDFHLAKRFYDQSREADKGAYVPVALALMKLRLRSWWNGMTGGAVNSIREDGERKKRYSASEWFATFLQADIDNFKAQLEREDAAAGGGAGADEWDAGGNGMHSDNVYGGGGDEFFDDDGIIETLAILGLAAALVFLVIWRQQRQMQGRRAEEQQQQGQGQQEQARDGAEQRLQRDPFDLLAPGAIGPG